MTLIEAVKSGKPFKRPCWRPGVNGHQPWVKSDLMTDKVLFCEFPHNLWNPKPSDLIAKDYEINDPDTAEKIVDELAKLIGCQYSMTTFDKISALAVRAKKLREEIPF